MSLASEPFADLGAALERVPDRPLPADIWLRRLLAQGRHAGISRLGDITGLDRIGLPVAQACRPRARSNAVTQGKGLTPAEAAVSALAECIEMAAAERPETLARWQGEITGADRAAWRDLAGGADWPGDDTRWLAGWDIAAGGAAPVPEAVVSTDFSLDSVADAAPILRSSIGLGAGQSPEGAAWQGMQEVIENDARIRFFAGEAPLAPGQIHLASTLPARHAPLLDRLAREGLRAGGWEMTMRAGPRCVMVRLMEDPARAAALPLPAEGFACRANISEALGDALLEAVQARLALISGAREDMTRALYALRLPEAERQLEWARLSSRNGVVPRPLPPAPETPAGLARLLGQQGLGPVLLVPLLCLPEVPLFISRVCAPGLLADPDRLAAGAP